MAMNDSIESYTETLLDKNRQINTILDTIEGTLMIVDIDGMIKIQSKVSSGITQENITGQLHKSMNKNSILPNS